MTTIHFDKKLTCGSDFVAVRIIDMCDTLKAGNIWLPDVYEANGRLAHCQVLDIGQNAHDKTGVNVGDYVMIDRLATFAWTEPVAALKYDSVIVLSNKDRTDFYPLKDAMFVEPDNHDQITKVGGVYVSNYEGRMNSGVIRKINFEHTDAYPFSVGDRVMLIKGGDSVTLGDRQYYIYKKDMIVCVIEDDDAV